MYAITYSFYEESLKKNFNGSLEEAEKTIVDFFHSQGFEIYNNNLFIGKTKTPVECVLTTQVLNRKYNWFKSSVLRMELIRVDEFSSLLPAILPNQFNH